MKYSFPHYILITSVLVWCLMLFIPPVIAMLEFPLQKISLPVYKFYSTICHQYESHSLHFFGFKLAVCERCFGIYSGFYIGCVFCALILKMRFSQNISIWIIAGIPMLIDVLLDLVKLHQSSITSRLATGLWFGFGAAIILSPIIIEAISEIISQKLIFKGVKHEYKA